MSKNKSKNKDKVVPLNKSACCMPVTENPSGLLKAEKRDLKTGRKWPDWDHIERTVFLLIDDIVYEQWRAFSYKPNSTFNKAARFIRQVAHLCGVETVEDMKMVKAIWQVLEDAWESACENPCSPFYGKPDLTDLIDEATNEIMEILNHYTPENYGKVTGPALVLEHLIAEKDKTTFTVSEIAEALKNAGYDVEDE